MTSGHKEIILISGGQTGADRAALDFALENGFRCGGWCPRERRAEDGKIPYIYPLVETDTSEYKFRTLKNIETASGTLLFSYQGVKDQGTRLTENETLKMNKPIFRVDLSEVTEQKQPEFSEWLNKHHITKLNVAGPRESSAPGIYAAVYSWLQHNLL